ncbi:MAG: hypothetical protein HQM14_07645 [SAR324 cluster bacterium]|nr:hypothetical protein [SAR324 cluster bacterium]
MIQREIESQGITTIGISLVRKISEAVKPPRTYFLKYPFGHALGEPFQEKQQMQIFQDCLDILESANEPGTIIDSPYRWRKHQFD